MVSPNLQKSDLQRALDNEVMLGTNGLPNKPQTRHHGIDLLRIVAMFMICALHVDDVFGEAKNLPEVKIGTIWVETFCIIAVNLYALVTGYVCVTSPWKFGRYIRLWMQVAFYAAGFYLFYILVIKALGTPPDFSDWHLWLRLSLPIPLASCYWYFTAYSALFLLIPFVNPILKSWSKGRWAAMLAVCLIVLPYSMLWTKGCCRGGLGHDALWLLIMYIAGAYARLHPVRIPTIWLLLGSGAGFAMTLGCYLWRMAPFANYFFPPIILSSVCVFLLFSRMNIRNKALTKLIATLAPFSFGVYLIHCHPLAWGVMRKYYPMLFEDSGYSWCFFWFSCIALYLGCSAADACRAWLFRRLHANTLADEMEQWLIRLWGAVQARLQQCCGAWFEEENERDRRP